MKYHYADFCVCPVCREALSATPGILHCTGCGAHYPERDGIPVLLPHYKEQAQSRYLCCYQGLAEDDLSIPLEGRREVRHFVLQDFVGDVSGKRVLDIGSSNGIYLRQLNAGFKVAMDLALPYLAAIPKDADIMPVCADAETLPFKAGFFDVIIISDILEHLLHPERLVQHLRAICTSSTRLIVHIPWKEDISHYRECKYEFAHLRSFGPYSFAQLWTDGFTAVRALPTYPSLEEPILFHLEDRLPTWLYSALVRIYYRSAYVSQYEAQCRTRWIHELPKRERWLLRFYPPKFKMFELRWFHRSRMTQLVDRVLFQSGLLKLR
ncbi:MAG: methyltransferase domain-containing protein [Nitrospiraceae bacterium]